MKLRDRLESFESQLGSPLDPLSALSFARGAMLDEEEQFPEEALEALFGVSLQDHYIPRVLGGLLESYEELLGIGRALSRRDLCIAVSCGAMLGSTAIWIGGSEDQKRAHARFLRQCKTACLAYDEEKQEAVGRRSASGYVLEGEKRPVNRATHSEGMVVLARTDPASGPRGLSLFMLEKDQLARGSFETLPRVKLFGVRGCDVGGVRLKGCEVPEGTRIGAEGAGLELALQGFQVTRALGAGLSLGAADTALRTTLGLAKTRTPELERIFAEAFLDLLICECVSVSAARALHVSPEQGSIGSAVVQQVVPATAEACFRRLSVVQGANFARRDGHEWGVFQRMYRDHLLIGLFEGSAEVGLEALSAQLPSLAEGALSGGPPREELLARTRSIFDLEQPLPPFEPGQLSLAGRGVHDATQGVAAAAPLLEGRHGLTPGTKEAIRARLEALQAALSAHARAVKALAGRERLELSRQYCTLAAATCCALRFLHHASAGDELLAQGDWVVLALDRLLRSAGQEGLAHPDPKHRGALFASLERLERENRSFSLTPLRLPSS